MRAPRQGPFVEHVLTPRPFPAVYYGRIGTSFAQVMSLRAISPDISVVAEVLVDGPSTPQSFQGGRLLSGSTDGTVRLWDFEDLLRTEG